MSAEVNLAAADFTLLSGSSIGGTIRFPAVGAQGAQYLLVGQFATGSPDVSASVRLGGAVTPAVPIGAAASVTAAESNRAAAFHGMLRRREAELARAARAAGLVTARRAPQPPPTVGTTRTFKVCASVACSGLKNVIATARYVGAHAAIFLDDSVPDGGFTQGDLDGLGAEFDSTLYPVDVAAFGAESDIDANGVVIILLTRQINALVGRPRCETEFITGYFFGADIAPGFATQYNNGEVFYGFVPDPAGVVSCPYSKDYIRRYLPVTFIHEFQHMISFNQHVLVRNGDTEILWLNEGLSHLAEEIGGRHYDSLGVDSIASQFLIGNLYNAFVYLKAPATNVLVTDESPGSLPSRGAAWLFARYLVDRFGVNVTGQLVQTSRTGAANVAFVTGTPIGTLLGRWALAVFASDLPDFTAPAALRYENWRFRATFQSLNQQVPSIFDRPFPLVPTSGGTLAPFSVAGTLTSGSGAYLLMTQLANAPGLDVTFRTSAGGALPAAGSGQLAVLRIR